MAKDKCGYDCPGVCGDRLCHYLRELADGRVAAITCRGKCDGRCVGRLDPGENAAPPAPASANRATVRTKELYLEGVEGKPDACEASCTVGCVVGHGTEGEGDRACYGACLGICFGVASAQELFPAGTGRRAPSA